MLGLSFHRFIYLLVPSRTMMDKATTGAFAAETTMAVEQQHNVDCKTRKFGLSNGQMPSVVRWHPGIRDSRSKNKMAHELHISVFVRTSPIVVRRAVGMLVLTTTRLELQIRSTLQKDYFSVHDSPEGI